MRAATAKASPSTVATWKAAISRRSARFLAALLGIASQGLLGLARVRPNDLRRASRNSASMKCLGQSHCFPRNALDSKKIVLGLLSCLEHSLECLPLMGGIQQSNDAVLWKVPAVACLKVSVEAILKAGTQAHWEFLLTREGASCSHELLEVGLYCADNLIPVAVREHLADVINGGVRLHGVTGAQLKEHGVPHHS
jgi:hypothetical protein